MEIKFKPKEKSNSTSVMVTDVAECFMNAAKSLHKLHLKIKGQGSYAAHNALNGYDKFHDLADQLIENYQGAEQVILEIPDKPCEKLNTVEEGINYLLKIKKEVTELQSKLTHSEIINLLDNSKEHINSILYKLKFLS